MNKYLSTLSWIIFLLIWTFGLSGCVSGNNEQLIERQLTLDVQKKRQFDEVFFNEIWLWNQTSRRYGKPSGAKRQIEFEAMAEQGYLPAYVALKMFDFEKPSKSPDAAAFSLLRQAADAGDVSSSCALIPIWAWNNIEGYPRKFEWAQKYIEYGAKEGHFACHELLAALYRKKIVIPPDEGAERRLLLLAAKAGYTHAYIVLMASLQINDRFAEAKFERAMCWDVASTLYRPFAGIDFGFYERAARGSYPQLGLSAEKRAEVGRLAAKWKNRMMAAKSHMDIANECLILEEEIK